MTLFVAAYFGSSVMADLSRDGVLNFYDIYEFVRLYTNGCP